MTDFFPSEARELIGPEVQKLQRTFNALDPQYGIHADGVTDDTAAIQNLLNIAAGAGEVWLPNKGLPYLITGTLNTPSHTRLRIDGMIQLKFGVSASMISLGIGTTDIHIYGRGIVDGGGIDQAHVNAGIWGIIAGDPTDYSSGAAGVTHARIEGITLQNGADGPTNIVNSTDVVLRGVRMLNWQNAGGFSQGCENCWCVGCYIDTITTDYGIGFYGNCHGCGIINCVAKNVHAAAFIVYSDQYSRGACTNCIISGCYSSNSSGTVLIQSATGGTLTVPDVHRNITVVGCIGSFSTLGAPAGTGDFGCYSPTQNVAFIGCVSENCALDAGFVLFGSGNSISNCFVHNCAYGNSAAAGQAVRFTLDTVSTTHGGPYTVSDCHIVDDQSTSTLLRGYDMLAPAGGLIASIHIRGGSVSGLSSSGSIINIPSGQGWREHVTLEGLPGTSTVQTPAVPSSGTALTNITYARCAVYLTGGTVTEIAINGTATGLTSGMVLLAPGDTITLTYSAAPTWVWLALP